jgi:hypothetical protein
MPVSWNHIDDLEDLLAAIGDLPLDQIVDERRAQLINHLSLHDSRHHSDRRIADLATLGLLHRVAHLLVDLLCETTIEEAQGISVGSLNIHAIVGKLVGRQMLPWANGRNIKWID